jgi:hypothetical protein
MESSVVAISGNLFSPCFVVTAEFFALSAICVTFSRKSDPKKGGGENRRNELKKRRRLAPRARFELVTLRLTALRPT